jgi:hypothetical protein
LSGLGCSEEEVSERAATIELDKYNIYGDINVESALSKLRRGGK